MGMMSIHRALSCVIFAAVVALAPGVALAAESPRVQLSISDVTLTPGESSVAHMSVSVTEPIAPARTRVQADLNEILKFTEVTVQSGNCAIGDGILNCQTDEDLSGVTMLGAIRIKAAASLTTGIARDVILYGMVNEISAFYGKATIAVNARGSARLVAIGAKVATGGATTITIKVGVKNVGTNPWTSSDPHPVIAYVNLPSNTFASSANRMCAGWGPYPEGWGWEDPGNGSYKYACQSGPLDPGDTVWFEMNLVVDPNKPVTTGDITIAGDSESAAIVVRTGSTLPVTGERTWMISAAGGALVAVGAIMLLALRRRQ